jgi:hypothetical protein
MFRDENRSKIITDHFDGQKTKGSDVAKKAKELWDSMSEEARKPWTDRNAELWSAFRAADPNRGTKSSTPSSPFNVESPDEVDTPSDWTGPHDGKILYKTIPGYTARGVGKFATFSEALEAANGLDTCGGITYDNKNGYQLRVGSDPNTPPSSKNGEVCWAKENHVMKNPEKKSRGGGKKPIPTPSEEDLLKVQEEMFGAETDPEEIGDGVEIEKVVVPSTDSDSDSDEDEDEDEEESDEETLEVEPWEYKGKTYLLDSNGVVYDYDSQETIGKKNEKGKLKLDKK